MGEFVTLHEVGPRDGLQNEARIIPVTQKVALIDTLAASGLKHIEIGSFVSPKWVPADGGYGGGLGEGCARSGGVRGLGPEYARLGGVLSRKATRCCLSGRGVYFGLGGVLAQQSELFDC